MKTFAALAACLLCATAVCQGPDAGKGDSKNAQDSSQSLADIARGLRKDYTAKVQTTPADARKLFAAVDRILSFAEHDSGFPRRAPVQRRLIGKEDVEKYVRRQEGKAEFAERLERSELTMKKMGLLPRNFNLREFLVKSTGHGLAAYYDDETKVVSLLNWVPAETQEPILAHELTHALQDQNFSLRAWMKPVSGKGVNDDEASTARRAVVEGQAMVVYIDYLLAPAGRSLLDTPGLIYQMEEPAVKAAADSELLHDAPMILRETGTFPYREGLIFEGELLQHGGRHTAFFAPFTRPPASTHEVIEPRAYLEREEAHAVRLPDLLPLLGPGYELYDSGSMGQLDVRALMEQYGSRKVAYDLASAWQGGAYAVFRKASATAQPATADLSFFYESRWKSSEAALAFARLYTAGIAQRYRSAAAQPIEPCKASKCAAASARFMTEEGLVVVEQWDDNAVTISESFDPAVAAKLAAAVEDPASALRSSLRRLPLQPGDLADRLYEFPEFAAFQAEIGKQVVERLLQSSPDRN